MWSLIALLSAIGFLAPSLIDAVSVCDEVDVVFVIDTASIIHNSANIIGLMDSIIVNGSSEFSGFSAVSYGHHLPLTADSVLFHLDDTKHIAHRRETQRVVHDELEKAFKNIEDAVKEGGGHTVSVLDAVKHGQSQHFPPSKKRKHELLGKALDYTMGHHDDDTIYIVFDYTNQLLSNGDICSLYQMVDAPRERDHFYFLFGQHLDPSIGVNCHREGGGILRYGEAFHHFDEDQFVDDAQELEVIYDLTCPATIHSHTYNGHITLHRNVQWLDPETITGCELHHVHELKNGAILDPERSIITAKDFAGDGNTFKALDYLMANPMNHYEIRHKGCFHPTYQIAKVMRSTELHHDPIRQEHYHILKLHVVLPSHPMAFMSRADVRGDDIPVNLNQHSQHWTQWEDKQSHYHHHQHYKGGQSRRRLPKSDAKNKKECIQITDDIMDKITTTFTTAESFMAKDPKDIIDHKAKAIDNFVEEKAKKMGASPKAQTADYRLFNIQMSQRQKFKFGAPLVLLDIRWVTRIESHVDFIFKWGKWAFTKQLKNLQAFPTGTHLKVELKVDWEMRALATARFNLLRNLREKLFHKGLYFIFAIGPVPVIMEPYIEMYAGMNVPDAAVIAQMDYVYKEEWRVGYELDTDNKVYGPISSRKTLGNKANPKRSKIYQMPKSEDTPTCPVEVGVDFYLSAEVGVAFYVLLKGYIQIPLVFSITMRFPDPFDFIIDTDWAKTWENSNPHQWPQLTPAIGSTFCAIKPSYWKLTLWYSVDMEVIVGGKIALGEIPVIGSLILSAAPSISWDASKSLGKAYFVLPTWTGGDWIFTVMFPEWKKMFPHLLKCCGPDKKPKGTWDFPRTAPQNAIKIGDLARSVLPSDVEGKKGSGFKKVDYNTEYYGEMYQFKYKSEAPPLFCGGGWGANQYNKWDYSRRHHATNDLVMNAPRI